MGALLECDCGGESASGARSIWHWHWKAQRPTQFSMIETFIGKSQKGDGFRSNETCRSGLSSIVHDEVFMFRKDKREIEVKRSRCGEDGG